MLSIPLSSKSGAPAAPGAVPQQAWPEGGRLALELVLADLAGAASPATRVARFEADVRRSADGSGRTGSASATALAGRLHLTLTLVLSDTADAAGAILDLQAGEFARTPGGGDAADHQALLARQVEAAPTSAERASPRTALAAPTTASVTAPAPHEPAAPAPADGAVHTTPKRRCSPLPTWRMKRTLAYIETHLGERISLADLAAAAGLTRMHFAAQFRALTGQRPHEYMLRRRIARAQEMMRETNAALVEIALDVGFQTQAHFTTVFKRFVGETPHRWRSAAAASAEA